MSQCCGGCKWANPSELVAMSYCAWPVPKWIVNLNGGFESRDKALMADNDGTDCPCFERREG